MSVNGTRIAASEAKPILYQHSDGRYGLSLTGQPATFTTGDPEWYRVPLDIVEPAASESAPTIRNPLMVANEAGAVPGAREVAMAAAITRALQSLAGDYPSMAADLRGALAAAKPEGGSRE
ncbi:hypothetical protein [Bordetella bronchialis]|uniref:Uncharacterized protein n=1 Tax=Bordetella bronchialis TaxID=463025 RepID=A0A193FV14_9BORD|nr:hypothetical protein [Bordetella bronchialis]ANN70884.1 hypothetical protein BAU08_05650 [Bordetella bronchialis]